ncbi:MAG: hypothetical protein QXG00_00200 [Candidatus Woesearchaeota archaeon]
MEENAYNVNPDERVQTTNQQIFKNIINQEKKINEQQQQNNPKNKNLTKEKNTLLKKRNNYLIRLFLSEISSETHIEEYHEKPSAWDSLSPIQLQDFYKFSHDYIRSLNNKSVYDRVKYIVGKLRQWDYVTLEELLTRKFHKIDMPSKEKENGNVEDLPLQNSFSLKLKNQHRFYFILEDTMIVAVQLGSLPMEKGISVAAAHIDSPYIAGRITKLKQNFNMAYLLGMPRGGLDPKDYFNIPMVVHFKGTIKDKFKKEYLEYIKLGEKDNDGKIIFCEQSFHLGENKKPQIINLEAIIGNRPYPDTSYDPKIRIILNIISILHKKYNLKESELKLGQLAFYPAMKPSYGGLDKSFSIGYGQDNWAGCYALLKGFLAARSPAHTKIAIFYDKEEISDRGKGSLQPDFINTYILPVLASVLGKELGDQFTTLRNSWDGFIDVAEPINSQDPSSYDKNDSLYFGAGVGFIPFSGDESNSGGFEVDPQMLYGMAKLAKENKIPYQLAVMGNYNTIIPSSSHNFHLPFSKGIDFAIPCQSLHRGQDIVSLIDEWFAYKMFEAFYMAKDRDKYIAQTRRK